LTCLNEIYRIVTKRQASQTGPPAVEKPSYNP